MKIMKKIKKLIKECWRFPLRMTMKRRLKNCSFSIISANCIGGVLTHDVGQRFRSPTINLTVPRFVEFCENLEDNLKKDLIEDGVSANGYPICRCGDIEIVGVHYESWRELANTWNKRRERVDLNNVFLIATDEYVNSEELAKRFDALPYPKVCFTANRCPSYDWMVFLPEFKGLSRVGDALRYVDIWGTRIFEKHFDCVKWLNDNIAKS